jgi:hypothetical protein
LLTKVQMHPLLGDLSTVREAVCAGGNREVSVEEPCSQRFYLCTSHGDFMILYSGFDAPGEGSEGEDLRCGWRSTWRW